MEKRIISKGTVEAYIDFCPNLDSLDDALLAQIKGIVEDCYDVEKIEVIDTRVNKYIDGFFGIDFTLYYENGGTLTKYESDSTGPEVDIVFYDGNNGEFDFSLFKDRIEELNAGLIVDDENSFVLNIDMYNFIAGV